MKRLAVVQSNYIPWKGYFDLIASVDEFVFYDEVQYTKNDWRNRNLIKSRGGTAWLSVPCGRSISRRICDVVPADDGWQARHWRTLVQEYRRAPHFGWCSRFLEPIYLGRKWTSLSDLNQHTIREIAAGMLGIGTRFDDSRNHPGGSGTGQERLLALLRAVGANRYLSGPAAKAYIDTAHFERHGVTVEWMEYGPYPEYGQFHPPFVHQVSVVDVLMHLGPDARRWILPGGHGAQGP